MSQHRAMVLALALLFTSGCVSLPSVKKEAKREAPPLSSVVFLMSKLERTKRRPAPTKSAPARSMGWSGVCRALKKVIRRDVGRLNSKKDSPQWSFDATVDPTCQQEATLSVSEIKRTPVSAKESSEAVMEQMGWLKELLSSGAPEVKLELTRTQASLSKGLARLKATLQITETWAWARQGVTLRAALKMALKALSEASLPDAYTGPSGWLCVNLGGLSSDVGMTFDPVHIRVTRAVLDALPKDYGSQAREVALLLENKDRVVVADQRLSLAGRVAVLEGHCGCDRLITVHPPRAMTISDFTFGPEPVASWSQLKRLRAHISGAGERLAMKLIVSRLRDDQIAKTTQLGDLLVHVYGGAVEVSKIFRTRQGKPAVRLERDTAVSSLNDRAKLRLAALRAEDPDQGGMKVCLEDSEGRTLGSFSLANETAHGADGRLGQLGKTLQGLHEAKSLVVINLERAGLASAGSALLPIPLGVKGRAIVERLKDVRASTPGLKLTATMAGKEGADRRAFLRLPVERLDGEKRDLRIPVELSQSLTIEWSDALSLTGGGLALSLPLLALPAATLNSTLKKMTTPWGSLRSLRVPIKALSVVEEPVTVTLAKAASGAGNASYALAFETGGGDLLGTQFVALPLSIDVRAGGAGLCAWTLSPASHVEPLVVAISSLEDGDQSRVARTRLINLSTHRIAQRPARDAPCPRRVSAAEGAAARGACSVLHEEIGAVDWGTP